MAIHGESSSLMIQKFPLRVAKQAIELILGSWKSFTTNEKLEDKITNKFYSHLLMNKDRSKYPFAIVPRPAEINEEGKEIGEIDLKYIFFFRV